MTWCAALNGFLHGNIFLREPRQRVKLAPGESKEVTLTLHPLSLTVFNTDKNAWQLLPGDYSVTAGPSSSDTPLRATLHIHP